MPQSNFLTGSVTQIIGRHLATQTSAGKFEEVGNKCFSQGQRALYPAYHLVLNPARHQPTAGKAGLDSRIPTRICLPLKDVIDTRATETSQAAEQCCFGYLGPSCFWSRKVSGLLQRFLNQSLPGATGSTHYWNEVLSNTVFKELCRKGSGGPPEQRKGTVCTATNHHEVPRINPSTPKLLYSFIYRLWEQGPKHSLVLLERE